MIKKRIGAMYFFILLRFLNNAYKNVLGECMGFLDNVFKKMSHGAEDVELDEIIYSLDQPEEVDSYDADVLVKTINLVDEVNLEDTLNELKGGNIIILTIGELMKRNFVRLKQYMDKVKDAVISLDGDIARISEDKLIVTPTRIKILKKRA